MRGVLVGVVAAGAFICGCGGEASGPNRPPVAVAGGDRVVTVLESVILDAGASFDPDGDDLVGYRWDIVAKPPGARAIITNRLLQKARLMPDLPGEWVVRLTVSDRLYSSDPDVLRIRALEGPDRIVCEGDDLVGYDNENNEMSRESCGLGCNSDADPDRCYRLEPSNVNPSWLCENYHDLVLTSGATINTEDGTITGIDPNQIVFHTVQQQDGRPDIGVFAFNTIDLQADLQVEGRNALALLACGDIDCSGVIDASALGRQGGPGGWDGGPVGEAGAGSGGGKAAADGTTDCPRLCSAGGGGGGHGGRGGDGGGVRCNTQSGMVNLAPGDGGPVNGFAELVPLAGGSGGAGGTDVPGAESSPGEGGGGGGAVQLSAGGHIIINAPGGVTVAGDGGRETVSGGGAGGGAGGGILLEALEIHIGEGTFLAANGGGGGGGDCT